MSNITENMQSKVNEIVKWSKLKEEANEHLNKLKAEILQIGTEDLLTINGKTITYNGESGNRVSVYTTEKLETVSAEAVKSTLGVSSKEYVIERLKYDISPKLGKIILPLVLENYKEGSSKEKIESLTDDIKKRETLKKKIKGAYKRDCVHLKNILDISSEEANYLAIELEKIINYEKIVTLASAIKPSDTSLEDYLKELKRLFFVEESLKIMIEYDKE